MVCLKNDDYKYRTKSSEKICLTSLKRFLGNVGLSVFRACFSARWVQEINLCYFRKKKLTRKALLDGLGMSLVWISKLVVSRIKEEVMNVFLCCCHSLNLSLCRLSPLLLSYVTVSRPWRLSEFLHQQGLTKKKLWNVPAFYAITSCIQDATISATSSEDSKTNACLNFLSHK